LTPCSPQWKVIGLAAIVGKGHKSGCAEYGVANGISSLEFHVAVIATAVPGHFAMRHPMAIAPVPE